MAAPIRILTAVPICDGHDSPINTLNLEFIRHGIEVIYLGYHRSARDIVRAAIQEDARAIGISSYNGGHVEFFAEVTGLLKKRGAGGIGVIGRGGGTTTPRLAIPSPCPGLVGPGALRGDRATMIYSQGDRVFMRSLATRGQTGGLSSATGRCLELLRRCNFDLVLVETVGMGQEAMPFG